MEIPRILIAIALPVIAGTIPACSTCAPHSIRLGSERVWYVVRGEGDPVVVLESDVGDGYESWSRVLDGVASATTTFAYSRAGYAHGSDPHRPAPARRHTPDDVAASLESLLKSVDLSPPYVLVGHGAGGAYMLRFAALHPQDVLGVVLVDTRLRGFRALCLAAGLEGCRPPGPWAGRLSEHTREELRGLQAAATTAVLDVGDLPVTVIAARKPPARASRKRQELWIELQRELASEARNGRFVTADGCGHHVQRDDPELVIAEIDHLLARVRETGERAEAMP